MNARDEEDKTALLLAASYGDTDIVNALLATGANVNAKDNIGETALMWAERKGRQDIFLLLIDAGAKE